MAFTFPGPEQLKTPEAFLATRELQALLLSGRHPTKIGTLEVEAIYRRHGLHGATRQALADHLYKALVHATLFFGSPASVLSERDLVTLDRIRTLLGAARR